jgi:hypothetical protein
MGHDRRATSVVEQYPPTRNRQTMIIGQVDVTQFKTTSGEWSIVAMLLTAFAVACSIVVYFYRKTEVAQTAEITELKHEFAMSRQRHDECEKDRLSMRVEQSGLRREIELLKEKI